MRVERANGSDLWLAYGMNVHPGGDLESTLRAIRSTVLPLKARLGVEGPFGLAVRWSAEGLSRLRRDASALGQLREALDGHDLHVFTGNAFVHGDFHGRPLKEEVYRPSWSDPERREYTLAFARVLADLAEPGGTVTLSTSPCGWRGWGGGAGEIGACAAEMRRCAEGLERLHEETGVHVVLAIEPEPRCAIETTAELRAFFAGPLALETHPTLQPYLGVCYDVCHQAVVHEDATAGLDAISKDGIRIAKLQASCALELTDPTDAAGREALARFDEPVYLHQVGALDADGGLHMADDLPEVLEDATGAWRTRAPWRSHFHVPVFREEAIPPLRTTQGELRKALRPVARGCHTDQVEIETYTWDVLPDAERDAGSGFDLVEALAREYEWVLEVLRSEATASP